MSTLICGYVRLDRRPAEPERLQRMLDALPSDGLQRQVSSVVEGTVALACVRLAPQSARRPEPPQLIGGAGHWLVADVRSYGDIAASSPEQVLADALAEPPASGLARLHADFVFAQWRQERGELLLGRDHFGVRPLQYCVRDRQWIAVASLPGPLLRAGFARREVDPVSIASLPAGGSLIPGRTLFRDLHSVPAAHCVRLRAGAAPTIGRYWRQPLPPLHSFDLDQRDAADEIRRRLRVAVARRLPADGPVAAHLSGGLDSTPIALLAADELRARGETCHAYSFQEPRDGSEVEAVDERPYVRDAAEGRDNLQVTTVSSPCWFDLLQQGIDADTMMPTAADEPENRLLADAAAAGACVVLSGWGGDEAVTSWGGGHLAELFRHGRWREGVAALRACSRRTGHSLRREFWSKVLLRQLPAGMVARYRRWRNLDRWHAHETYVTAPMRGHIVREYRGQHADSRRNRRVGLEAWWIQCRLERFAQIGARFGIAYAYPMLDRDLLDYAMRLPGVFFQRDGVTRSLIRDATRGLLPDSVRLRDDKLAPFPLESLRAAQRRDALLAKLHELARDPLVARFLDVDAISADIQRWRSVEQIREQLAADAAAGRQFTSEEDDYEDPLQLAIFLSLQSQQDDSR